MAEVLKITLEIENAGKLVIEKVEGEGYRLAELSGNDKPKMLRRLELLAEQAEPHLRFLARAIEIDPTDYSKLYKHWLTEYFDDLNKKNEYYQSLKKDGLL